MVQYLISAVKLVNECFGDEVGNYFGYTKVARFKIL